MTKFTDLREFIPESVTPARKLVESERDGQAEQWLPARKAGRPAQIWHGQLLADGACRDANQATSHEQPPSVQGLIPPRELMSTQELTSSPRDVTRAKALAARRLRRARGAAGSRGVEAADLGPPGGVPGPGQPGPSALATPSASPGSSPPPASLPAGPRARARRRPRTRVPASEPGSAERSHVGGAGALVAWGSLSR